MSSNRIGTGGVLWEVVAPVVRWPLWSPVRFFATLAALFLALVFWTKATSADETRAASVEAPEAATAQATAFLEAWGDPMADRKAWLSSMRRMGTPTFVRTWAHTDPGDIPVTTVDEMTAVLATSTRVIYSVSTNGPRVQLVLLQYDNGAWKVASIEPEAREKVKDK